MADSLSSLIEEFLRAGLVGDLNIPQAPQAPRPPLQIQEPQEPASKIPVVDNRDVPPTKRLGLSQATSALVPYVGQAARSHDIDPNLLAAILVTEGRQDIGQNGLATSNFMNFLEKASPEAKKQLIAESAARRLRLQASYASQSPLVRQIQSYNGLGKLPAGHYGLDRVIDAGVEVPYGKRVLDIKSNIVEQSPELLKQLNTQPQTALSPMVGLDHYFAEEIMRDLALRLKKPHLLQGDNE
jgi:hypothetical protein